MADPLTDEYAVAAALLRPLTTVEDDSLPELIDQVSSLLRTRLSTVDARMALWGDDPAVRPSNAIDPAAVRAMLADVIARRLSNPERLWSASRGDGPYTQSKTFAGARGGADAAAPPGLMITDTDLASLVARPSGLPRTIKLDTRAVLPCNPDPYVSGAARAPWAET